MTDLKDIKEHLKKINDSPIYDSGTMLVDGKEFDRLVDTFNALEAELTVEAMRYEKMGPNPISGSSYHFKEHARTLRKILGE